MKDIFTSIATLRKVQNLIIPIKSDVFAKPQKLFQEKPLDDDKENCPNT